MPDLKNTTPISTTNSAFKDRDLIPHGEVRLEDLHPSLKEQLFIIGELTVDMFNEDFKSRLRLSGEITFDDLKESAKTVFARNGYIDWNHLSAELRQRFVHADITEQQLASELVDKINSSLGKTIELIDCGSFTDNLYPEEIVYDGGEW